MTSSVRDIREALTQLGEHGIALHGRTGGPAFQFGLKDTGVACSVCAPYTMNQRDVEAWAEANVEHDGPLRWCAIDKSKPPLSAGRPTPHPCNHMPGARLHWFLVCGAIE